MDSLSTRILFRRTQLGLSQAELGRRAGYTQEAIAQIEGGQILRPRKLLELAKSLDCSANWLSSGQLPMEIFTPTELAKANLTTIFVVGEVQAGVFAEALEWPPEEFKVAPVSVMPGFAHVRQFGLLVRGRSMNLEYPEGSTLICVKFEDLGRNPKPGEHVIVHRVGNGGYEATVKELRLDEDGQCWLWPRSDHPDFQQPWRMSQSGMDDGLEIYALVIGSFRPSKVF